MISLSLISLILGIPNPNGRLRKGVDRTSKFGKFIKEKTSCNKKLLQISGRFSEN